MPDESHSRVTTPAVPPRLHCPGVASDQARFRVALEGSFAMNLRPSELRAVSAGLGKFDACEEGDLLTLVEALRGMPTNDRAAVWELAVRRYGRHKPLAQAAGEIGMDEIHARELLDHFSHLLATVPPPEHVSAL